VSQLIVVENTKAFPLSLPGVEVITARHYLTDPRFTQLKRATVFNLCRNQAYQSLGYYVSLLAAARNHRPLPSLATIQDLRHDAILRIANDELDAVIQRSLRGLRSDEFELSIYFGKNFAQRHDRLCQALFDHYPAPLLRATFKRTDGWNLSELRAVALSDVPESHHEFLAERARRYFARPRSGSTTPLRYDLAILVNEDEADAPSDRRAIKRFVEAARQVGIRAFVIGRDEYPRIAEYDALFIRETTGVTHHTFRFASRAAKEGLVVVDDPESILRCCNKVYQAEAFDKAGIPCPRTMVVHRDNRQTIEPTLGLPCVLKRPDSAFSTGVVKASTRPELESILDHFLDTSELVVAQAFVPSDFDWRIGVLGGRPLYACRYYMARGHWQITKMGVTGRRRFGKNDAVPLDEVPAEVVDLAVRAARLMGTGLYGVDLKEADGKVVVMEVNDNPNIDAGVEDAIIKDELYLRVMRHFYEQLERRGR
jgi:glutathione synthase/RimK-type ligase-like ATP-grasp enzyme